MTTPNGQGFPGMSAPMGAPAGMGAPAAFVLDVPPDPTWEPFESTDVLETDGYYMCRVTRESARADTTKKAGVFLTLEIQDEDARGKILSKFMNDPRATQKQSWFVWRNLIRSITGGLDNARAGFQYTVGMLAAQGSIVYVKTAAYNDDDGQMRTGVDGFHTKDEYEAAVQGKRHRWPAKVKGGAAALPSGLPTAFPGASFPGLAGAPVAPVPGAPPVAPQPTAAAPMVQPQTAPAPAAAPPAQGFGFPPPGAPPVGAAPPAQGFAFPAPQVAPAPPASPGFPFPPPPAK